MDTKPEFWVVLPVKVAGWAHDILKNLSWGFNAAGYKSLFVIDYGTPESRDRINKGFMDKVATGEPFVLVDLFMRMKMLGIAPELVPGHFTHIGDSPIHHFNRVLNASPKTVIGIPDRRYREIYETLGFQHRLVFVPYSGCDPVPDSLPMAERDVDLLFTGTLGMLPGSETWKGLVKGLSAVYQEVVDEALAETIGDDVVAFMALARAFERRGIDWREEDAAQVVQAHKAVETYAETIARWDILSAMEGLNLHFMGDIAPEVQDKLAPFTKFHRFVSFDDMLETVKRTKLLINICPKLSGGSHTRIWNGIAYGCVNATTRSTYLDEDFVDGVDLVNFPDDLGGLKEQLAGILDDPEKLDGMVASSRDKYTARHLWKHRAEDIAKVMMEKPSSVPADLRF